MGIDATSLKMLCYAKSNGVSFASTAMIGRQFCFATTEELTAALGIPRETAASWTQQFSEPVFRQLGAQRLESVDHSSYEGASVVHDMNQPIPGDLKGAFSCVVDLGTIEHIFNFPQAVTNCMEMVAVGGHYVCVTPANNFMGHGFYQFSPELFYRVLTPANGYQVEAMFLAEVVPESRWYYVQDPAVVGGRVELVNHRETYVMFKARRVSDKPVFATTPQQSDYAQAWRGSTSSGDMNPTSAGLFGIAKRLAPWRLKQWIKSTRDGRAWPFQADYYKRFRPGR
jgi:hypothetical protein